MMINSNNNSMFLALFTFVGRRRCRSYFFLSLQNRQQTEKTKIFDDLLVNCFVLCFLRSIDRSIVLSLVLTKKDMHHMTHLQPLQFKHIIRMSLFFFSSSYFFYFYFVFEQSNKLQFLFIWFFYIIFNWSIETCWCHVIEIFYILSINTEIK